MKKRKALLAAIAAVLCGTVRAQEITSYFPADKEDYRGYSITNVDFQGNKGYVAAGNRTEAGKKHTTIHLLAIPSAGAGAMGSLLSFNDDDVRAVAINELKPGVVVVTVQARNANASAKILVVTVDYSSFSAPVVVSSQTLGYNNLDFYPLGATIDQQNGQYYACGFICTKNGYPSEPDETTPKYAMVSRLDLSSGTGDFALLNSPVDYTPPPSNSAWNGQFTDYDLIQNVKLINGKLYAVGSDNGSASTNWYGSGIYSVNNSKIWVAQLDNKTLNTIQMNHFGKTFTGSQMPPSAPDGFHGTDIVEDVASPGNFYVTGQDMYWHTWTFSSVQPNLKLTPGSNSPLYANTLTYFYSADIKGHGAFTQVGKRISLYGTVRASNSLPLDPAIASPWDGAIPFVTSFDPAWGANGLTHSGLDWWIEGNRPSSPTYLPAIYSPYLMASPLSRYGIPQFAAQYDAPSQKYELAMMGHIGDGSTTPNISPRFINSDEDGKVPPCPASIQAPGTFPGVGGIALFDAKPYQTGTEAPHLDAKKVIVKIQKWVQSEDNCTGGGVYRQPATTAVSGTAAPHTALALSPNPASDKLSVQLGTGLQAGDEVSIVLTDVTGRRVASLTKRAGLSAGTDFALPALSEGMYNCTVRLNGALVGTRKVLIR